MVEKRVLQDRFQTLDSLKSGGNYYSLKLLQKQGIGNVGRLPFSIRIVLESFLRNCDDLQLEEEELFDLASSSSSSKSFEVSLLVSHVLLQDFTAVPLLVDLAAMRDAVARLGGDPSLIQLQVAVDLVIDHSVQVDYAGNDKAFISNLNEEWKRNRERYQFLRWSGGAFPGLRIVPPGIGICHQVNLEYLASVTLQKKIEGGKLVFPETLVGTDSHTTMINSLGVLGWGVGGIEAQSAMLGEPIRFPIPQVVGVFLHGSIKKKVYGTDLALYITEQLRKKNLVGKFVEFFGEGARAFSVADRATIANMAPEYGATTGFFPCDHKTLDYLRMTGRKEEKLVEIQDYLEAQGLWGIPNKGEIDYTEIVELNLSQVDISLAGPFRPQDRIDLSSLKEKSSSLFPLETSNEKKATHDSSPRPFSLKSGAVVIAAITSCTNTSNPEVMMAAGLLAKKAVEKGLTTAPWVKSSLAPGSRVVTDYLLRSGLQQSLDYLGFHLVAYGCTTCIGNSGPLKEGVEEMIEENQLVAVSVLSGNRNFEGRIHKAVKANFLMSPPLVLVFAIAGRIDIDLEKEPLGYSAEGSPIFFHEIWPSSEEVRREVDQWIEASLFKERYASFDEPRWNELPLINSIQFPWDDQSHYLRSPPYFDAFSFKPASLQPLSSLRAIAILGDSITTDHISPAGSFSAESLAGQYLLSKGVESKDFNSYGSRRGNHLVMMRGTFANPRLINKMAEGKRGGFTKLFPENKIVSIYEASQIYGRRKERLILFAGKDYGMGSSRDWAAKGSALLGIAVVVARSFERIHRSNLVGMGVLPLEFQEGNNADQLDLTGEELFEIIDFKAAIPNEKVFLKISRKNGETLQVPLVARIDTKIEIEYYRERGIMPHILRRLLKKKLSLFTPN